MRSYSVCALRLYWRRTNHTCDQNPGRRLESEDKIHTKERSVRDNSIVDEDSGRPESTCLGSCIKTQTATIDVPHPEHCLPSAAGPNALAT